MRLRLHSICGWESGSLVGVSVVMISDTEVMVLGGHWLSTDDSPT